VTSDPDLRVRRILEPRSKAPAVLILLAAAIVCVGLGYRSELYAAFVGSTEPSAPPAAVVDDRALAVDEIDSVKREMTQSSQFMAAGLNAQKDALNAQKVDIQKLTDQISALSGQLAALNEKLDTVQNAQASKAPSAETHTDTPSPDPPRHTHIAARKRVIAPKPDNSTPPQTQAPSFPTLVPQSVPPSNSN
jgi:hypothetical protein